MEKENYNYKDCFNELVKQLSKEKDADKQYIGMGNPNAKVLFVGRERGTEEGEVKQLGYASWWEKGKNESFRYEKPWLDEKNKISAGSTLRKYQKLYENIYSEDEKELYFEKNVFNTDVNVNPSVKTKDACTTGMEERKKTFFTTAFIQQFPVVVLACSNYFKPQEIYDTFGVSWQENNPHYCNEKKNRYWYAHYNADNTKLVIHTVQLSGQIGDRFLQDIGKVIRDFLWRTDNDFRWNNGGKEIYEKIQNNPEFMQSKEYQDYMKKTCTP